MSSQLSTDAVSALRKTGSGTNMTVEATQCPRRHPTQTSDASALAYKKEERKKERKKRERER